MPKQYRVEIVEEGALGTLFFGSSKLPLDKMETVMNSYGKDGWSVCFQIIEKKRFLLFWERESAIITFEYEYDDEEDDSMQEKEN